MHSKACTIARHQTQLLHQCIFLSILTMAVFFLLIAPAFAMVTPMGTVLCKIVEFIYGNLGRALSTLAVVIVGIGATLGKVSWGLAMTVAVGIAVIFNADWIIGALNVTTTAGCT